MHRSYRLAIVTAAVIAASPALAAGFGQGVADKGGREPSQKQKAEAMDRKQRLEETERNYKATIKSQPDSKEKFDPWKGSR
jgi:hypothetical protein